MKRFILLALLLISGCSSKTDGPITSPSGAYVATADVPADTSLVRLKVTEASTKRELTFQTRASDVQKWALAWSPSGSLVLWSSDIGTYAYDIDNGHITEREAVAAEIKAARGAYKQKYGKEPHVPRPPQ